MRFTRKKQSIIAIANGRNSATLPEIVADNAEPVPKGGEITCSTVDSRRGGYDVVSDDPTILEQFGEYSKAYSRNMTAVSVRLTAHLLMQEAAELGKTPNLGIEELHTGIENRSYKVAIAMSGACMKGVAVAERFGDEYVLTHWYMVQKERAKGYGKQLLLELGVSVPEQPVVEPNRPTISDILPGIQSPEVNVATT